MCRILQGVLSSLFSALVIGLHTAHLLSVAGQVRRRGRRPGHFKLNLRPRDSLHKPEDPCHFFEREWQNIQNASREGVDQATDGLKTDTGPQYGTDKDACEGEASGDIECGCCCSDYRFEEMVQVKSLSEVPSTMQFILVLCVLPVWCLCNIICVLHSSILNLDS